MEQDLNKYIVNEFCKLQTDTKQRSFIENFRFLIMSNDFDFENYYSNKALRRTDFYSIADMLYQLGNLIKCGCLLACFLLACFREFLACFIKFTL